MMLPVSWAMTPTGDYVRHQKTRINTWNRKCELRPLSFIVLRWLDIDQEDTGANRFGSNTRCPVSVGSGLQGDFQLHDQPPSGAKLCVVQSERGHGLQPVPVLLLQEIGGTSVPRQNCLERSGWGYGPLVYNDELQWPTPEPHAYSLWLIRSAQRRYFSFVSELSEVGGPIR